MNEVQAAAALSAPTRARDGRRTELDAVRILRALRRETRRPAPVPVPSRLPLGIRVDQRVTVPERRQDLVGV